MEEVLKKWGEPALISAVVALLVALVNRRLPFQQKLNEAQLATLEKHFQSLMESYRLYINQLNRVIFGYEAAIQSGELSCEELKELAIEFRQAFGSPEILRPAQDLMHAFVVPSLVRRAVAEYVVNTQALVAVCLQKTKETGAQSAWDFALHHVEEPISKVASSIREALCIDELTLENQRAAGVLWSTRIKRIKLWWRWKVHKERPADPFHSLMYHAQMSRLQDMAFKFMGAKTEGEVPEYHDLFATQTSVKQDEVPVDFKSVVEPFRKMRAPVQSPVEVNDDWDSLHVNGQNVGQDKSNLSDSPEKGTK